MESDITAAYANRQFSQVLRSVREAGRSYVVTSHGKPVARIVPAEQHASIASGARAALLARLERQAIVNVGHWTRDELYESNP